MILVAPTGAFDRPLFEIAGPSEARRAADASEAAASPVDATRVSPAALNHGDLVTPEEFLGPWVAFEKWSDSGE